MQTLKKLQSLKKRGLLWQLWHCLSLALIWRNCVSSSIQPCFNSLGFIRICSSTALSKSNHVITAEYLVRSLTCSMLQQVSRCHDGQSERCQCITELRHCAFLMSLILSATTQHFMHKWTPYDIPQHICAFMFKTRHQCFNVDTYAVTVRNVRLRFLASSMV